MRAPPSRARLASMGKTSASPDSAAPPLVPTSFAGLTRAIHLVHARTISGRLDEFGQGVLEDLVGEVPTAKVAKTWLVHLEGKLAEMREAGEEPPLPPETPSTRHGIDVVTSWLDRVAKNPQGIEDAAVRKKLFRALGGVFPAPSTAAVWRDALLAKRDEIPEKSATAPDPERLTRRASARKPSATTGRGGKGKKTGGRKSDDGGRGGKREDRPVAVTTLRRRVVKTIKP